MDGDGIDVKYEAGADPSDDELKAALRKILESADLQTFTKRAARRQLESALGLSDGSMEDKKQEIGEWINELMAEKEKEEDDDDDDDDDAEEEAEPEQSAGKKKGKGWGESYLKPALMEFTGKTQCGRSEVVKLIWQHVKANDLQDPTDKRYIVVDDRLRGIFGQKKRVHMFTMNKELTKHFGERVGSQGPSRPSQKAKSEDSDDDGDDEPESKPVKRKAAGGTTKSGKKRKAGGGFAAEVVLSPELGNLLGASTLPRTEVVRGLWTYIKANSLQNPSNKNQILPDAQMKMVFGSEPFTGFSMMKLLKPHLTKPE